MNITPSKAKPLLVALIAVLGASMFLIGQDVLAQEVVVTDTRMEIGLGIAQEEAHVSFEADAHLSKVYIGALARGYDHAETSEDNLRDAEVYFSINMTIYNAIGHVLFNRTMMFEKGAGRTISVYTPLEDVELGTSMTIVVDMELEITRMTPEGDPPAKNTITKTIHEEITVPVAG